MTTQRLTGWCLAGCVGLAGLSMQALAADAAAPAAPPAARKKAAPVKVSTTQLFTTLGTLESKIDAIQKSMLAMPRQAAPTVQMPGPGEGMDAKNMMQAFYNYGSYRKQAENKRLAASVIRDLTVLGGISMAFAGWESARDKTNPRTMNNAYHDYPLFSYGVTTALVGYLVGEFIGWSASSSDKMAAAALMRPLEAQPQTAP